MNESKQLIVVGGPNGSGKTTFVRSFLADSPCIYLGADDIAVELAPENPEAVAVAAGRLFVERFHEHIEQGQSLIVESTLSGKSLVRYLEKACRLGFSTVVYFTFLDSEDACVARVRQRVKRGGHNVPEDDIRRRYLRSLLNFWESYRYVADHWMLHHNSGEDCLAIASGVADNYIVLRETPMQFFLNEIQGKQDD